MPPGFSSMMEKQPQIRLSTQACLKAATSGPSIRHMIAGLMSIDRPCSAYSGNTTRSIVPRFRRALPTISTMTLVWAARSSGVTTVGNWSCTRPRTTPCSDLFNPPRPFTGSTSRTDERAALARARQQSLGHIAPDAQSKY